MGYSFLRRILTQRRKARKEDFLAGFAPLREKLFLLGDAEEGVLAS